MTDIGIRIHGPRNGTGGSSSVPVDTGSEDELAIRAPATSRLDERIAVRVEGVVPGERVTVRATLRDDEGAAWTTSATFTADADGVVDLTEQAPDSGDWSGVAPMGWCWAMSSEADRATAAVGGEPTVEVTFTARASGTEISRTVTRQVYDERVEVTAVEPDGMDLVGTWYVPPEEGPHPAVVSLHGGGGRRGPDRTELLLATRGVATLALSYVGEAETLPDRLERVSVDAVADAVAWVSDRPDVADGPVGLFGVSRGAELALEVGARTDAVGPVVSYAGSGIRYDTPDGTPAWVTADGDVLPHLSGEGDPEVGPDGRPVSRPVLERGFEAATAAEREAAAIPVEDIDGPVLLVSGGDDEVWPARRLSAVAADRLADADRDAPHAHLTADRVGHLIGVPYVPLADFEHGGGTPAATAALGVDAWERTLEYFELGLPGGSLT